MTTPTQPDGFTLIEVIVALMVLSVGILAMGASTGHVLTQIQMSELRTERVAVVRQAAETLRSADFHSVESVCAAASTNFGTEHYDLSCMVWQNSQHVKRVELISVGPGFVDGKLATSIADTFAISVSEPLP
jgi:prepilin-type N-terminal cleavage/methylation domain-containing protein